IAGLGNELRDIASRSDSNLRVGALGHDEIARLAQAVNNMLGSLAQVQNHLRESEKELRDILSNIDILVIFLDMDGRLIFSNNFLSEHTGWSADELIGRDWFGIMNPECPELKEQYLHDLETGEMPKRLESDIRTRSGERRHIVWSNMIMRDTQNKIIGSACLGQDVTERLISGKELKRIRAAIDDTSDAIVVTDEKGSVVYMNVAFSDLLKHTVDSLNGMGLVSVFLDRKTGESIIRDVLAGGRWHDEITMVSGFEKQFPALISCAPIMDDEFKLVGLSMTCIDLTERKQAEDERRRMETHLMHSQKLESVGQLAAGIAHEINTPIQFIGDNLQFLGNSFGDLLKLLDKNRKLREAAEQIADCKDIAAMISQAEAQADVQYLESEIPKAIEQSRDGAHRVADIVRAMKEFSHPSTEEKSSVDINRAIETTAIIARNEWKYIAEMKMDLDRKLPTVVCLPGDFNQVMLNLIVNAAHAIADHLKGKADQLGLITISTSHRDQEVEIRVTDTGTGISEANRPRIFEPFFTTKEVGRGTGQGLAMAYNVIVKKHAGKIRFDTEPGSGTTFIITLPIGGDPT
ncbi:MAG: PAS domain S-box protein, partial [Lentisphaerota bacterium]